MKEEGVKQRGAAAATEALRVAVDRITPMSDNEALEAAKRLSVVAMERDREKRTAAAVTTDALFRVSDFLAHAAAAHCCSDSRSRSPPPRLG